MRHVTTRLDTLSSPCILAQEKSWRALSRLSDSTARHARHDKLDSCDSHDVFWGVATAWTWVDMSTSLFFRSCSWDWCKSRAQKTKLSHASTTVSSSFAMLEQARRGNRDTLVTSHVTSRQVVRVVTQQVEFGQYKAKDAIAVAPVYRASRRPDSFPTIFHLLVCFEAWKICSETQLQQLKCHVPRKKHFLYRLKQKTPPYCRPPLQGTQKQIQTQLVVTDDVTN